MRINVMLVLLKVPVFIAPKSYASQVNLSINLVSFEPVPFEQKVHVSWRVL